jgi:lysozyme
MDDASKIVAGAGISILLLLLLANKKISMTQSQKNLKAFLVMIQYSEGTLGKDAYRKLYGGGTFDDLSKHPNTLVNKWGIKSTAAGAYQILNKTWQGLAHDLGLQDFTPQSQDRAAIELIARRKALDDVMAGRFAQAIEKCRKEWASLPGAGYHQSEKTPQALAQIYKAAGGNVAV